MRKAKQHFSNSVAPKKKKNGDKPEDTVGPSRIMHNKNTLL